MIQTGAALLGTGRSELKLSRLAIVLSEADGKVYNKLNLPLFPTRTASFGLCRNLFYTFCTFCDITVVSICISISMPSSVMSARTVHFHSQENSSMDDKMFKDLESKDVKKLNTVNGKHLYKIYC